MAAGLNKPIVPRKAGTYGHINEHLRALHERHLDTAKQRTSCARCGRSVTTTPRKGKEWFEAHKSRCPGRRKK